MFGSTNSFKISLYCIGDGSPKTRSPAGRGRGRARPTQEVYVPRARRMAEQAQVLNDSDTSAPNEKPLVESITQKFSDRGDGQFDDADAITVSPAVESSDTKRVSNSLVHCKNLRLQETEPDAYNYSKPESMQVSQDDMLIELGADYDKPVSTINSNSHAEAGLDGSDINTPVTDKLSDSPAELVNLSHSKQQSSKVSIQDTHISETSTLKTPSDNIADIDCVQSEDKTEYKELASHDLDLSSGAVETGAAAAENLSENSIITNTAGNPVSTLTAMEVDNLTNVQPPVNRDKTDEDTSSVIKLPIEPSMDNGNNDMSMVSTADCSYLSNPEHSKESQSNLENNQPEITQSLDELSMEMTQNTPSKTQEFSSTPAPEDATQQSSKKLTKAEKKGKVKKEKKPKKTKKTKEDKAETPETKTLKQEKTKPKDNKIASTENEKSGEDEAEEESWDAMFDDTGECLDDDLMKEVCQQNII